MPMAPIPGLPEWQFTSREPCSETIRICACGDIALSGRIGRPGCSGNGGSPFREIGPLLKSADIVVGNLESPLLTEVPDAALFAAPLNASVQLAEAGFTLLHLANNHVCDYGAEGLGTTTESLHTAGITPLGVGETKAHASAVVRTDMRGLRVGWLACGRTLCGQAGSGPFYWEFDEGELSAAVSRAVQEVDILIVSMHIGFMYLDYPHPEHKKLVERLLAAGASLVLMHHPHVLQGVQVEPKGGVACFSLGNLLVDPEEGNVSVDVMIDEQRQGAVFVFDLDRKGVCSARVLPTWIDDDFLVRWAVGPRGDLILDRLRRITEEIKGDYSAAFSRQRAERNSGLALKVLWHHARKGNFRYVYEMLRKIRPEHARIALRYLAGSGRSRSTDLQ